VNAEGLADNSEKFYCEPYTDVWEILKNLEDYHNFWFGY
jgi:hypothetical protein